MGPLSHGEGLHPVATSPPTFPTGTAKTLFLLLLNVLCRPVSTLNERICEVAPTSGTDLPREERLVCKNIKALISFFFFPPNYFCIFRLSSHIIVNTRMSRSPDAFEQRDVETVRLRGASGVAPDANTRLCRPRYACTVDVRTAIGRRIYQ